MIAVTPLLHTFVRFGISFIVITFSVSLSYVYGHLCWDFNFVPFKINPGFTDFQQSVIKEQISKINHQTCVYWSNMDESNYPKNLTHFVQFLKVMNNKCQTMTFYPQKVLITLSDRCFLGGGGDVLHEIVHALGFHHEQKRVDRDCYVWVSETTKNEHNFKISTHFRIENIDRFPYDKESIMHYSRTIVMKSLSERFYEWEPLGRRDALLSELDLWKIQYRFCGRPHYCEVHPQHCSYMEQMEAEMNCISRT